MVQAVSEALSISPSVFGAGLAADDLILTLYFVTLYSLAAAIPPEPQGQDQDGSSGSSAASTAGSGAPAAGATSSSSQGGSGEGGSGGGHGGVGGRSISVRGASCLQPPT